MKKYFPNEIEPKWQEKWKEEKIYLTDLSKAENKYYVLVELPYTSGDLHMGHWFTFTMADILAKFKRSQGFNVLFPNGFDAFGLPAENAAIKKGIHPRDWTYKNIERMKAQFETMGASIDWKKTATTCDSEYYKWNQWIFLKMLERGIAYRGTAVSNWCPNCNTVLANENVESGKCWRCGTEVVQKSVDQWFLKLTEYADRLLWSDPPQADWPKPLRMAQNDWIGKSEGTLITFGDLEVFTTRPDTIFGATFVVVSPEYPLLSKFIGMEKKSEIEEYVAKARKKSEIERRENKEKTGVPTGSYVKNPLTGEDIPVWVADYVLPGYGTGAIMAVPAHDERDFEFAKKFDLPIKTVISEIASPSARNDEMGVFTGEGILVNSGEFNGLSSSEAKEKISDYLEQHHLGKRRTNYHLHDWSISRQRYWGTPIPVIHCDKCGIVPVPEKDLPVELPYEVDYTPQGKPPLATVEDWVNVACPKCGWKALREVETMDGFVDNSWYFYRYLDSHNSQEIFDKKLIAKWMPLDIYIGGAEHTVGHTLYSRFFTRFFHDLGLVSFDEYSKKRINHGVILGPDGSRMSKSKGNVVNPDEEVKKYGADAIRLYLMFLGPFDIVTSWNPDGVNGSYHFLERVWGLMDKVANKGLLSPADLKIMHKTIKKVGEDIEQLKFNTAIAALMEWLNYLSKKKNIAQEEYKTFLLLLAPFAPHMTEELWQMVHSPECIVHGKECGSVNDELPANEASGQRTIWSIHQQSWPEFDQKYLEDEEVTIVVQINGKVRDRLVIQKDIASNKKVVEKMALESSKVQKFIEGKEVRKTVYIPVKIINFVVS